jgi:hypothetical protein
LLLSQPRGPKSIRNSNPRFAYGIPHSKHFSSFAEFCIMPEDSPGIILFMTKQKAEMSGGSGPASSLFAVYLSFLCLLLLCGCQSPIHSLFTATGPGWQVRQGQALWRPQHGMPEFGGDFVIASDDTGRHLIQFDKTPMNILSAQTTSNRWLIQFPQRHLSFSGFGRGSTRFSWLYVPEAVEGGSLPKVMHFERKPDGGWRLENSATGETIEGYFSP